MKITVDGKPLLTDRTGIGQYTYNILQELARLDLQNEYYLRGINNFGKRVRLKDLTSTKKYDEVIKRLTVKIPFPLKKVVRIATSRYASVIMQILGTDLFWGTNFLGVFHHSFKTAITIHDMAYQYFPETIHPLMYRELTHKLHEHAHRAHAIIAVSESTKRDIVKFLRVPGEKIRVIYNGVSSQFQPIHDPAVLDRVHQRYKLPGRFILFVGMLEPRKNIVGLLKAFKGLTKDPQFKHGLVIVGSKGWKYKEIFKTVEDLGLKDRVMFTGYVPDEDLPSLYNLSDVFVYPSFYEGFGMPVIEAMACGTPVITSNLSSLPEVAGDAALYVNPEQIDEIAFSVRKILTDDALRHSRREAGLARSKAFSWENTARQTLKIFEDCVS